MADTWRTERWDGQRGVTAVPGLYFVGHHWPHKRKSSLICGVGEDADIVAKLFWTSASSDQPLLHEGGRG